MKNKVLIQLSILELEKTFDVFVPVNEVIWKIKKLLVKSVSDLCNVKLNINDNYELLNKNSGIMYKNNDILIHTDIRNGSELVLLMKEKRNGNSI